MVPPSASSPARSTGRPGPARERLPCVAANPRWLSTTLPRGRARHGGQRPARRPHVYAVRPLPGHRTQGRSAVSRGPRPFSRSYIPKLTKPAVSRTRHPCLGEEPQALRRSTRSSQDRRQVGKVVAGVALPVVAVVVASDCVAISRASLWALAQPQRKPNVAAGANSSMAEGTRDKLGPLAKDW